jgi:hypothetical protein
LIKISKRKLPLVVNLHSDFNELDVSEFLDSLITAMKNNEYDTIHIDQLIELRNKIYKRLL